MDPFFLTYDRIKLFLHHKINYKLYKIFCIHERRGEWAGSCEGFPSHFSFGLHDKVEQQSSFFLLIHKSKVHIFQIQKLSLNTLLKSFVSAKRVKGTTYFSNCEFQDPMQCFVDGRKCYMIKLIHYWLTNLGLLDVLERY